MKLRIIFFFFVFTISSILVKAQAGYNEFPTLPYTPNKSVLFGKDIVINDQPDQDQKKVAICSAYNGQLFAAIYYTGSFSTKATFLESDDNGMTWNNLIDDSIQYLVITKLSLTTTGNNLTNLRLLVGMIWTDTTNNQSVIWLTRYKVNPFLGNGGVFPDLWRSTDFSLASDILSPASGSNPTSFGVLYSKVGVKDSIVFESSSNGSTIDTHRVLAVTTNHFGKVALSYAKSSTYNTGRYFAVWEEKENVTSTLGHIYTSHSEPNFNSPFTTPVCLDSLSPATIGLCRNPAIACQQGNMDNDISGLSAVVLFEKYSQSANRFDIQGYYNKNSAQTNSFQPFSITNSLHNNLQPDITFNPFDSTFILTYFDSTAQKLPSLTKNLNLVNPNSWNIVTGNYNDFLELSSPFPKLTINPSEHSGANVWIAKKQSGDGVALFDSYSSTYTGISQCNSNDFFNLRAYPNPCSNKVTIEFQSNQPQKVNIYLLNLLGQKIKSWKNQTIIKGTNKITLDLINEPAGSYIYLIESGNKSTSGKLFITR